MVRAPCCDKIGLKKGPWTTEEDEKLASYIDQHGMGSWRTLPKKAGLLRCGKSCRLRWTNYLRPDIKRGEFSGAEEQIIIQLHALLGNRWSAIATHLPQRTDNEIKNYWNTHLKKRLVSMGLDPATHKPKLDITSCGDSSFTDSSKDSHTGSSFNHMAQWENARLEAEARLAKETSLRAKGLWLTVHSKPAACETSSKPQHGSPTLSGQLCSGSSASLPQKYEATVNQTKSERSASKGLSASTIQNWENSLQGQAGLMWPESWRFTTSKSGLAGLQESSPCSSPHEQLNYGSPTSTLCFSDHVRKLSWSDMLKDPAPRNCSKDAEKSITSAELDASQAVSSSGGERSLSSLLEFMREGVQLDCLDIPMEKQSRGGSMHSSGSLLHALELELVSDDMSSSKSSSNISNDNNLDSYWDNLLVDSPKQAEAQESMCI